MNERVNALMVHFNLKVSEITLPTSDEYDDEFTIFGHSIEVLDTKETFQNLKESLSDNEIFEFIGVNHIAEYTRLSNSNYFFKWL